MYGRSNGREYRLHVEGGKCENDSVEKHEWENKQWNQSLYSVAVPHFLTAMKKSECNDVKCDKFDNKILMHTWDQV